MIQRDPHLQRCRRPSITQMRRDTKIALREAGLKNLLAALACPEHKVLAAAVHLSAKTRSLARAAARSLKRRKK